MSGSLYEEPPHGHHHETYAEKREGEGVPVLILGIDIAEYKALVLRPNGQPYVTSLDFITWDWRPAPDGHGWIDSFAPATELPEPALDGEG